MKPFFARVPGGARPHGETFSRLLDELVRERVGLAPPRSAAPGRERALRSAMERAGVTDEAMYLALVTRDQRAFDALISDLTVPETYFFRDPAHYELLRREVLPALSARGREHVLEVWSAGCASGEEPYSLAMLLEQELLASRSHVLGTDVSARALARAKKAVYGRWSLRATSERDCERYFEPSGREYRLNERITKRVRFQQHSLTASAYPSPRSRGMGFDLILCRNVLIYFDPAATAHTAQMLASSLSEDGWLMLGPSDPVLALEAWCDTVTTPCGLLYRRRRGGVQRPLARHTHLHAPHAAAPRAQAKELALSREPELAEAPLTTAEAVPTATRASAAASDALPLIEQLQVLLREHGPAAAEAGCRDLLSHHALSAPLHLLHASLLLDLDRDAEAEQALRRAQYLDRSLLLAQLLGAALRERSGARAEAARAYEQLSLLAHAQPKAAPVLLGDGMTCGALADLADRRARALSSRGET